ncbi:hypothetical protein LZ32DRAFT_81211 [Colletotrichum eremochloae]|nr:hypothetical protein LZ32DRAFT_81211 [Colletotrichum eremochloae]
MYKGVRSMTKTEPNHALALFGQMDLALRLASPSVQVEPRQILYISWMYYGRRKKEEKNNVRAPFNRCFSPQRSNDACRQHASGPTGVQGTAALHLTAPHRTALQSSAHQVAPTRPVVIRLFLPPGLLEAIVKADCGGDGEGWPLQPPIAIS